MQPKTLISLVIALAVLLGLWYGQRWWQQRQLQQSNNMVKFVTEAQVDQVNKIVINVDDQSLILNKKDNVWRVNEASASAFKVDELLAVIKQPQLELVSQNPERFTALGIADNIAKQLQFWQGDNAKATIFVSSPSGQLVRKKDTQEVYKLAAPLTLTDRKSVV